MFFLLGQESRFLDVLAVPQVSQDSLHKFREIRLSKFHKTRTSFTKLAASFMKLAFSSFTKLVCNHETCFAAKRPFSFCIPKFHETCASFMKFHETHIANFKETRAIFTKIASQVLQNSFCGFHDICSPTKFSCFDKLEKRVLRV